MRPKNQNDFSTPGMKRPYRYKSGTMTLYEIKHYHESTDVNAQEPKTDAQFQNKAVSTLQKQAKLPAWAIYVLSMPKMEQLCRRLLADTLHWWRVGLQIHYAAKHFIKKIFFSC